MTRRDVAGRGEGREGQTETDSPPLSVLVCSVCVIVAILYGKIKLEISEILNSRQCHLWYKKSRVKDHKAKASSCRPGSSEAQYQEAVLRLFRRENLYALFKTTKYTSCIFIPLRVLTAFLFTGVISAQKCSAAFKSAFNTFV